MNFKKALSYYTDDINIVNMIISFKAMVIFPPEYPEHTHTRKNFGNQCEKAYSIWPWTCFVACEHSLHTTWPTYVSVGQNLCMIMGNGNAGLWHNVEFWIETSKIVWILEQVSFFSSASSIVGQGHFSLHDFVCEVTTLKFESTPTYIIKLLKKFSDFIVS